MHGLYKIDLFTPFKKMFSPPSLLSQKKSFGWEFLVCKNVFIFL